MWQSKEEKKKMKNRGGRGQIGVDGRKGKGKKECYGGCNSHLSFIPFFFFHLTLEKD